MPFYFLNISSLYSCIIHSLSHVSILTWYWYSSPLVFIFIYLLYSIIPYITPPFVHGCHLPSAERSWQHLRHRRPRMATPSRRPRRRRPPARRDRRSRPSWSPGKMPWWATDLLQPKLHLFFEGGIGWCRMCQLGYGCGSLCQNWGSCSSLKESFKKC